MLASLRLGLLDVREAKGKLGCLKNVRKNGECSLDFYLLPFGNPAGPRPIPAGSLGNQ